MNKNFVQIIEQKLKNNSDQTILWIPKKFKLFFMIIVIKFMAKKVIVQDYIN